MYRSPGGPPFAPGFALSLQPDARAGIHPAGDLDRNALGPEGRPPTAATAAGLPGDLAVAAAAGTRLGCSPQATAAPTAASTAVGTGVQRTPGLGPRSPTGVARRVPLHANLGGEAPHSIDEIDIQAVVNVLPCGRALRPDAALAAEEIGEEIPEIAEPTGSVVHPAEIEPTRPGPRLRPARSPRVSVMAELIVLAPLLLVAEDLVGRRDLLEFSLGRLVPGIHVGVIFPRQLAIGALDLLGRGAPGQAQHVIVIPLCHASLSPVPHRFARHAASMETCRG